MLYVRNEIRTGFSALFLIFLSGSAEAADLSSDPPPVQAIQEAHRTRAFYVRGDVGIGRLGLGGFSQADLEGNGGTFISESIGDTPYIGAGAGWQLSPKFRFDLTAEYRSTADVKGLDYLEADLLTPDGTLEANTLYQGNYSAFVGLANAYWDIFQWRGFTPYIGAGIGLSYNMLSDFTTQSTSTFTETPSGETTAHASSGVAGDNESTKFAWALMAGTSYDISPNGKLDIGYRYLNLGSDIAATTALINCICGQIGEPFKIRDLDSHEFRIGIRWSLDTEPRYNDYVPMK